MQPASMKRGKHVAIRVPMKALRVLSQLTPRTICFTTNRDSGKRVALTFDDGPHPEGTPRILEVLADAGVAATFFFQGDLARRWPGLVRQAHAAGHQIASHGMQHVSALHQHHEEILDNARQAHTALSDIVGAALPRDYRPPYGEMTVRGLQVLLANDYRLVYWSYDSRDSFVRDDQVLVRHLRQTPPRARSIVLFHDDYQHTASALGAAVAAWREEGLAFGTVAQLCGTHIPA